ncbi:MAG: MoaD/ThiS family protein [Planctomycetota bacterium]|nr:MoaD/ThiS family protein [Planctomycetota bacterium]
MTIRVLLFAVLAQKIGAAELSLPLPAGATVGDALAELARLHPAIAEMRGRVATAVGLEYVRAGHPLADGDELALIPPVSGG